jgi:hypothetical protein
MTRKMSSMRRSSALPARLLALLIVVVVSTGLLATGPAQAVVATPATPVFGAAIDAYSAYERENTCSPTAKPGTVAWRDLLLRTYGTRWNNITRACSASDSGHEEGRALDWRTLATDATQKAQGDALLAWLLATDKYRNPNANARRLGMQYIQFNNRMWRAYNPTAGWLPQMETVNGVKTDCAKLGPTYVTTCHRDHIHFSMSWNGAYERTTWFTGAPTCPTPATPPAFTASMPVNMTAVPITPLRVLDTRSGAAACRLAPGSRLDVQVTGVGAVPSTGVGAVALNITAVRPTGSSTYLSAYPTGTSWGGTSSVNVPVGGSAASLVTVPVGSNGMVSIHNGAAPVDVVVDIVSYFETSVGGARYFPISAQRLLDTRSTSIMAPGEHRILQVTGTLGIPTGANGVLVNVTSTRSTAAGFLAVSPAFGPTIGTSTVNYALGDTIANRAITGLSDAGTLELYASSQTDVVIDIVGWFGPGTTGLRYSAVTPARILDTRNGTGGVSSLAGGTPAAVSVSGQGGIPSDAEAVVATLTITQPTQATFATIWPEGGTQPGTSDVNLPQGSTRANMVSPALSTGSGQAALTVAIGSANAVLDVLGYFR